MQRSLIFVIAVVAAGWVRVTVAQSGVPIGTGEPWLPHDGNWPRFGSGLDDSEDVKAPSVFRQSGLESVVARRVATPTPVAIRFGSGLDDDSQARPVNVFHQSGLEGLTAVRVLHPNKIEVRFGSGLEDDAPVRPPSVFRQSGL